MSSYVAWSQPNHKQAISQNNINKLTQQKISNQENPPIQFVTPQQRVDAISHAIEATADKAKANQNTRPRGNSSYWFSFFLTVFTGLLVLVGAGQCYII